MRKKNEIIPIEITDISTEGNGVGRFEGMAVFVPYTAVGDRILARLVKVHKHYAYAIVEQIVSPSPKRMDNDCPVFGQCGGCSLRHIDYQSELAAKAGWVSGNLQRIGGIEVAADAIIPSPMVGRYRNKAQYPIRLVAGRIRAGFFARRSHRLIPVADCKLQPVFFKDIVHCVTSFLERESIPPYDDLTHSGLVRHLFIRWAEQTGEVMVWLSINGRTLPKADRLAQELCLVCPNLASFGVDINTARTNVIFGGKLRTVWGKDSISDILCGVSTTLSPLSFYQVNRSAAEKLFESALEYADPSPQDKLLDLYCGAGAVGLSMAHRVGALVGVEIVEQAVCNAIHNAAQNGIKNARFICADAFEAAEQLKEEGFLPDILVLDPPRKGADEKVIACIGELSPEKIVYISCDSATLARDCRLLARLGYQVVKARAADLFPRTSNVESCCLLVRR